MIVLGAGGLATQLLDVIHRVLPDEKLAFFDNTANATGEFFSFPVLSSYEEVISNYEVFNKKLVIGIAGPRNRKFFYDYFQNQGIELYQLIASTALIGKHVQLNSTGCIIMEHCIIESGVEIGAGVLINTSAKIFHHSVIGNFCEIAPNCSILGRCEIEDEVFIGANATVLPGVKIGKGSVIGAGTLVTRDVPEGSVVKGFAGKIS